MTAPCKDCPDRKIGCHSECEHYKLFKELQTEISAKKERVRKSTPEICRSVVKQIWKEMKGR